jgi:hypothetical protein
LAAENSSNSSRSLCRFVYNGSWSVDEVLSSIGAAPSCCFAPSEGGVDENTIYYMLGVSGHQQLHTIAHSGSAWATPQVLTSGAHLANNRYGPNRVMGSTGELDVVYFLGTTIDDTNAIGQLMGYPSP